MRRLNAIISWQEASLTRSRLGLTAIQLTSLAYLLTMSPHLNSPHLNSPWLLPIAAPVANTGGESNLAAQLGCTRSSADLLS